MIRKNSITYKTLRLAVFLSILGLPSKSFSSPDVKPHEPIKGMAISVFEGLEIISSSGCLPTFIYGDAVKTQQEIGRLLVEAEKCWEKQEKESSCLQNTCGNKEKKNDKKTKKKILAKQVWKYLKDQYEYFYNVAAKKTKPKWNKVHFTKPRIKLQMLGYENDERAVPNGGINAKTSPITAYREGFEYAPGKNILFDINGALSLGTWFDVEVEPFYLNNGKNKNKLNVQAGNIKFTWHNFEVKAGRNNLYWGQGRPERVIFSGNARPIDMLYIGSPYPFKLMPLQYRVFLGVLDDREPIKYPFLLGGKLLMKPHPTFELSITRIVQFGGNHSPSYSFWEPFTELIGFRPKDGWIFNIPFKSNARGATSGFANNILTLDFRLRLPCLRNSEIFFEMYNEDPIDIGDFLPHDSIFSAGIWIPKLTSSGTWQMLVQGAYLADIVYTHSVFSSGFTNRSRIMGMDNGPNSFMAKIWVAKLFPPKSKIWGSITYIQTNDPTNNPDPKNEKRPIFELGATQILMEGLRIDLAAGSEYMKYFNFQEGNKWSMFGSMELTYNF